MENTYEEIEKQRDEIGSQMREIEERFSKLKAQWMELDSALTENRKTNTEQWRKKYLRVRNKEYIYVLEIGTEYNGSLCGLGGPHFHLSSRNEDSDLFDFYFHAGACSHSNWHNDDVFVHCVEEVEVITEEEFFSALKEATDRLEGLIRKDIETVHWWQEERVFDCK